MSPLGLFWERCEGPIVYGVNDCCMVFADVIVAAGGPDLAARYRGRYRTRLGFVRAFRKAGHKTLDEAATAEFSRFGKRVADLRDFDVGIVSYLDDGRRVASPAFYHSGYWFLRSERGGMCVQSNHEEIYRVI